MESNIKKIAVTGVRFKGVPNRPKAGLLNGAVPDWLSFTGSAENRLKEEDAKSIKMSCPAWGVHIWFESARVGHQVDRLAVSEIGHPAPPGKFEDSLFLLSGHIEFPACAAGENFNPALQDQLHASRAAAT